MAEQVNGKKRKMKDVIEIEQLEPALSFPQAVILTVIALKVGRVFWRCAKLGSGLVPHVLGGLRSLPLRSTRECY